MPKGFPSPITDDQPSAYVGLELEEARRRAEQHGWSKFRVFPDDGTALLTADWVGNRINVGLSDENRVTRCSFH